MNSIVATRRASEPPGCSNDSAVGPSFQRPLPARGDSRTGIRQASCRAELGENSLPAQCTGTSANPRSLFEDGALVVADYDRFEGAYLSSDLSTIASDASPEPGQCGPNQRTDRREVRARDVILLRERQQPGKSLIALPRFL